MTRIIEVQDPVERLCVYASALTGGIESAVSLLACKDKGFILADSEESGLQLALGKLQSISDTYEVLFEDTHPGYTLASELGDLLKLLGASEARWVHLALLSKTPVTRHRWRKSVIDTWPFVWGLIAKLSMDFIRRCNSQHGEALAVVREFGEKNNLGLLTSGEIPGGRPEAIECMCIAGRLQRAMGTFSDNVGELGLYFTVLHLKRLPLDPGADG